MRWKSVLLAFAALLCNTANAKVTYVRFAGNERVPALIGEIKAGDARDLLDLYKNDLDTPRHVIVNSPGGSVTEAVLIAQILRKAGLGVTVLPGGKCASACFFIFIAGIERRASGIDDPDPAKGRHRDQRKLLGGFVGIHRPFLADITSREE